MGILTFDACASIYNIWISHEIITQGRVLKIKFRKFKFFYSNYTAVSKTMLSFDRCTFDDRWPKCATATASDWLM